jgi:hypothetical protein
MSTNIWNGRYKKWIKHNDSIELHEIIEMQDEVEHNKPINNSLLKLWQSLM